VIEDVFEPLELVQDHQVRLQMFHRCPGYDVPHGADELESPGAQFLTGLAPQIVELLHTLAQLGQKGAALRGVGGFPLGGKAAAEALIESVVIEVVDLPLEVLLRHAAFEEAPPPGGPGSSPTPRFGEHPVQQHSFLELPALLTY